MSDMYDAVRRAGREPVPEGQVPADERMTPAEFAAVRDYLGLTQDDLAERLGVRSTKTIRSWAAGTHAIPDGVRVAMEQMEDDAASAVGELVEGLVGSRGDLVLAIPREGYRDGWPARWWRHVAMRVAVEVPGLSIVYEEARG